MPIEGIGARGFIAPEVQPGRRGGESFAASLTEILQEANRDQVDAARQIKELIIDGKGTIHEAMSAMGKAEGSFRLLMEMRNRLVQGIDRLLQTRG